MSRRWYLALLATIALLLPSRAQAGFFGDLYDYWSSGRLGEDMLNAVGVTGEDLVYAIDNPDKYWEAVKDEASSGRAGERLLGYAGLTPEEAVYMIDNPDVVGEAIYDEWASGRAGTRILAAVQLTPEEVVYLLDHPEVLGNALHDEWASGRAGDRLIQYGHGLYEGGRDFAHFTVTAIQDGGAYVYIISTQEDYQQVSDSFQYQNALVQAYRQSDDPGATTALLLNNLKQLPSQFVDDMYNDPRATGRTVGLFATPVAAPKALSAGMRTLPKVPGFRWTGTTVRMPWKTGVCSGTAHTHQLVTDLRNAQQSMGRAGTGPVTIRVATGQHTVQGQVLGRYSAVRPGPLAAEPAKTFAGARYTVVRLTKPTTIWRLHNNGTPVRVFNPTKGAFEMTRGAREMGGFWSLERPAGSLAGRIDSALLPHWGNSASHLTGVQLPAGTTIMVGEVGSQGGFFVGGGTQLLVEGGVQQAVSNGGSVVLRTVLSGAK